MKRTACVLLTGVLTLSLFAGCGKTEEPTVEQTKESLAFTPSVTEALAQTQPVTEKSGLLWDLHEENPVDDSLTISLDPNDPERHDCFESQVLPQYMERWADNAQILDKNIVGLNGEYIYGWVLFSGTPKAETGWNTFLWEGQPAFCRRFLGRFTEDAFHLEQSQAAAPLPTLDVPMHFFGEGHPAQERDLSDLRRAELYVRQLGRTFVITEPEKLEILGNGLVELSEHFGLLRFGGIPLEMEGNPLILDLGDRGQRQIMTDPDGSASTTAWRARIPVMAQSIFELFGVPLEPAGYSRDVQGNTVVELFAEPFLEREENFEREITVVISPDNHLVSQTTVETMENGDYESTNTEIQEFTYNAMGKPEIRRITVNGVNSLETYHSERVERYTYDAQGRKIRTDFEHNGALEGYDLYEYDDQGRRTAVLWYLPDGTLGPASQQSYWWYDEDGLQYDYRYDNKGNVEGTPPETPVRRGE